MTICNNEIKIVKKISPKHNQSCYTWHTCKYIGVLQHKIPDVFLSFQVEDWKFASETLLVELSSHSGSVGELLPMLLHQILVNQDLLQL